jgi:hypothetical protein
MKILTQDEVLDRLRKMQGGRSAAALAKEIGISAAHMSEIFRKTRHVPKWLLGPMGLCSERTITVTYFELNGRGGK